MNQWSTKQDAALKAVDDWYKNHKTGKQTFYIAGFAGTGKTTLAMHFAQNIGGGVKFASFTGKAAHVMASKGCAGACTIHRLIYKPKIASKVRLNELKDTLDKLEAEPEIDFEAVARTKEEITKEQDNVGRMSFSLNHESDLRFAKLLILDECSMIDKQMGKDLESFKVPILVLGDPEQLPPIYGAGYFTEKQPDILLDEIHRQALGNPIITMSKFVREGNHLPVGEYGASRVIDQRLEGSEMLEYDIILTGLRKTKQACDNKCRKLLAYTSVYPQQHDQIMCVKNNHQIGLLNGQIWEMVNDAVPTGGGLLSLHIRDPETGLEMAVTVNEKLFLGQPLSRWEHEEDIEEFEYAYGITVHKAQGSQWNKVLLFDQKNKFPNWSDRDRRRWLYTGITRAAEALTVMRL